jgi:HEAT repeat protein
MVAAALLARPPHLAAQAPAAESAVEAAQKDLQEQEKFLVAPAGDKSVTIQQREQAAKRLVSRVSPRADEILLRTLNNLANAPGQLAVARALGSDLTPDGRFIDPLGNLLGVGSNSDLTEAAAQALAVFKTDDRARDKLWRFVTDLTRDPGMRAAGIRAMGRLVDKKVAGNLMQLLGNRNDNPQIHGAVTDALGEMTGLRYGNDVQLWELWWQANRGIDELEWSTELLRKNAALAGDLDKRLRRLREETMRLIREDYRKSADPGKTLAAHLKSESEDVRWAAVRIIYDEAIQSGATRVAPEALAALRTMIGDSSIDVREQVARALAAANDPGAVEALLAQLSQERDSSVQAAILGALGPLHDLRSIEPLLGRLGDERVVVAKAAADALRDLAVDLRKDGTGLADRVAARLRERFGAIPANISTAPLRGSLVEAMARLGRKNTQDVFYAILDSGQEPVKIRRDALRGLGLIGDANAADHVVKRLEDPDRTVRYEAAAAMETTATKFTQVYALANRLLENIEPEADVRKKSWEVMVTLLDKLSEQDLGLLDQRFRVNDGSPERRRLNQERRLAILSVLEKKMAGSGRSGDALAAVRQDLGDMLLSVDRAEEAVVKFQQALDFWTSQNKDEAVVRIPRQRLMTALLQAGKFGEFVDFGTALIEKDRSRTTETWQLVQGEVKRLEDRRDFAAASAMIEQVKKLPWGEIYSRQVQLLEERLAKQRTTSGSLWVRQPRRFEQAI